VLIQDSAMNDIKKDKIDRHSDELEVESDEKLTGKKIELDEDRLLPRHGDP
jgi:hypothetical protein